MSDTTALSHQYATHAEFVERLNRWIRTVKRHGVVGAVPESDLREAQEGLAAVLQRVRNRLAADCATGEVGEEVPDEVIRRLESDHRGDNQYYRDDLATLPAARELPPGVTIEHPGDAAVLGRLNDEASSPPRK